MDLTISPPKWPQNRSSAVCQQNLRPIGSLFPSHTEYKAVHSGTVETRKRLGWHIQSVTSTRMEQDIVEPDFIILSVISQIYWRRWTQTVVLHRCLCQSLFSINILLLFSKWKSVCWPGIFQSTYRTSQTTQHSKVGAARVLIGTRCLNYVAQQLQLSVVDRFQWTNSRCVLPWWHPVSHYLCLFRTSLERLPHTGISSSSMCRLHKIQLIWLPGVPVDKRIHNNLQWHGPSWLTDHPSQWPSWRSTQFYSKMSEQNTKQSPGPDVMYETTALAGIPRENSRISLDKPVAPFDIIKWNYSC